MAFTSRIRTFLDQPLIARIAVIDANGFPHAVPIWYALDGDDVIFFSSRSARKIGYMKENPKGAMTAGGDPFGTEGYLLKGEFSLEEDHDHRWLDAIVHRYEPKELADRHVAEWGQGDLVLMRFMVNKISRIG